MADIFISYKRQDSARVEPLVRLLERADYTVWWDEGLEPGDEWFNRILDELECSNLTLGIWSEASIDARGAFTPNREGKYYVKNEHDRTKSGRLIPVLLDEGRIALEFSHLQAVSLVGWRGEENDACARLTERVAALLGAVEPVASLAPKVAPVRDDPRLRPGAVWRDAIPGLPENVCAEMVTIPPGRFLMGAPVGEAGSGEEERPQHEVKIDYTFALGRFPITFDQWDAAAQAGAKLDGGGGWFGGFLRGNRPVNNVTMQFANDYIGWLNAKLALRHSDQYRLPTEAEWDYACRAGPPALLQMRGKVWQWCEDVWHDSYHGAPVDGSARTNGVDSRVRVLRGGDRRRMAKRRKHQLFVPSGYEIYMGFRVARTLSPA